MDWRGRSVLGGRAALWLSVAVALSSVLTSVLTIGIAASPALVVNVVLTEIRQTAEFLGALVGFCLLLSVLELRRGFRAAWYATTLFITVGGVLGAIQSSGLSLPTVVLALIALPVVLGNRGRFDRELDLSTAQVAALTALGGALVYSTVGAYALREEFGGVDGLVDAFYFAVVTASTVGYGDVTANPDSPSARLFVVSVVVVSTASFALALGSLLGPAIEARLTSALGIMTDSQLEALDDHVIVLGYGDLTEPILDELGDRNDRSERTPFVVVTPETPAAELRETDRSVLVGNPSDDEPLRRAGIERARAGDGERRQGRLFSACRPGTQPRRADRRRRHRPGERPTLLCRLAEQHANNERTMSRDRRYVTNTAYSGVESLVISRFRCTTQERRPKAQACRRGHRDQPRGDRRSTARSVGARRARHGGTRRPYRQRR